MNRNLSDVLPGFFGRQGNILGLSRLDWHWCVGIMVAQIAGYGSLNCSTAYMAALVDGLGLLESGAGYIVAMELGAVGVTGLIAGTLIDQMKLRFVACLAAALVIVGNLSSIVAVNDIGWLFYATRIISGCGFGLLLMLYGAIPAITSSPDRAYAVAGVGSCLAGGLSLILIGYLVSISTIAPIFAFEASMGVLIILFLRFLPHSIIQRQPDGTAISQREPLPFKLMGSCLLFCVFLYGLLTNMLWVLGVLIGIKTGLDVSTATYVMGVSFVVSGAGFATTWAIGNRYGRWPLILTMVLTGVFYALTCIILVPLAFVLFMMLANFLYGISTSYLFGTAAALDSHARWSAPAPNVFMVGLAVAPAVGGFLVERISMTTMGLSMLLCSLIIAGLLHVIVSRTHLNAMPSSSL